MRKIDFIVPQYKEDEKIVKNLLDSIAIQQSINFNDISVIIINDGSEVLLNKEFLESYPYKIQYIKQKHGGVSAARNTGLKKATAEYVMFCDADDMFCCAYGLFLLFDIIKQYHEDIYITPFTEETINVNNEKVFSIHGEEISPFIHGKVFRRLFLLDKNIYFPEYAPMCEDMYVSYLAQGITDKVRMLPTSIYLWKWRDDSTCRSDPLYIPKAYEFSVRIFSDLIEQFCMRGNFNEAIYYTTNFLYDIYYTLNLSVFSREDAKPYIKPIEIRAKFFYNKYKDTLLQAINPELKNSIIKNIKRSKIDEDIRNGFTIKFTFKEWINHLEKI